MNDTAEILFGEAADMLVKLEQDGGADAAAIADRITTSIIPTIMMAEDLELADVMLNEAVGDIIAMQNEREGR